MLSTWLVKVNVVVDNPRQERLPTQVDYLRRIDRDISFNYLHNFLAHNENAALKHTFFGCDLCVF
jgi:hypothetical protein